MTAQTIYALATGARATAVAIAIIRISGPSALKTLHKVTTYGQQGKFLPRHLHYTRIVHPISGEVLDTSALCTFMPQPSTATGEDVAELHVHGGNAVITAILEALGQLSDLRPATAGEFTRRAYVNGKMSLSDVEALSSLLQAQSDAQRRLAVWQSENDVQQQSERLVIGWRQRLVQRIAAIEAHIDFAATDEIDPDVIEQTIDKLRQLREEIGRRRDGATRLRLISDGARLCIVGRPNVGKSSLMNAMCQFSTERHSCKAFLVTVERERAIVSDVAGTTRDTLRESIQIGGNRCTLIDTAGMRLASGDRLEAIGIERARRALDEADVTLLVIDATSKRSTEEWSEYIKREIDEIVPKETKSKVLVVINKTDLLPEERRPTTVEKQSEIIRLLWVSCRTLENVDCVGREIERALADGVDLTTDVDSCIFAHARQRHLLEQAVTQLDSALLQLQLGDDGDLCIAATALRRTLASVDELRPDHATVSFDVHEHIIDSIFSSFCIGK